MDYGQRIGERIRQLRLERGISGHALSRAIGKSPAYISALERGEVKDPGVDAMARIATALGTTVSVLQGVDTEIASGYDAILARVQSSLPVAVPLVESASMLIGLRAKPAMGVIGVEYLPGEFRNRADVVAGWIERGQGHPPEIQPSDTVIVDLAAPTSDGALVAIWYNNEVRYGRRRGEMVQLGKHVIRLEAAPVIGVVIRAGSFRTIPQTSASDLVQGLA